MLKSQDSLQNKKRKGKGADLHKVDSCLISMRSLRNLAEKEAKLVQHALRDMEDNLIDPSYILDLTKSIHVSGSKNITDYINRNTEILLNEHASVVRQKVIHEMKQQIQDMNTEMKEDAKKLNDDISNFFEYIECNYKAASASFQRVLELAKNNFNKTEQIKEMENKLFVLKSELHELEQEMLECLMCYAFLYAIDPQNTQISENVLSKQFLRSFGPKSPSEEFETIQSKVLEDILAGRITIEPFVIDVQSTDVVRFIEHFKDSNLSLLKNMQVSIPTGLETTKFESSQNIKEELENLDSKINDAQKQLETAKENHEKLQTQIRNLENEDKTTIKLQRKNDLKKLTEIYKLCVGSDVHFLDIALMKITIEDSMEKLFNEINEYPKKKVKELLKMLDAEKKLAERKLEESFRDQRAAEQVKKTKIFKKNHGGTKNSN